MEHLYSFFSLFIASAAAMLFFGVSPLFTPAIIPALPLIFGMGFISGKKQFLRFFWGFMATYALAQILLAYFMNATGISYEILQQGGIFFLIFFGIIMFLSPNWKEKGMIYGVLFGFIWSFWAAIPYQTFNTDLDLFSLLFMTFLMFVATSVLSILFAFIGLILSQFYPEKYLPNIQKAIGLFTFILSGLLLFGVVKTPN